MQPTKRLASLVKNRSGEEVIKMVFSFNGNDLNNVRTIEGRKWHKEQKCWYIPLSRDNIKKLREGRASSG